MTSSNMLLDGFVENQARCFLRATFGVSDGGSLNLAKRHTPVPAGRLGSTRSVGVTISRLDVHLD